MKIAGSILCFAKKYKQMVSVKIISVQSLELVCYVWNGEISFSNSLIIHEEKTKQITTVKEVWKYGLNYHKSLPTLVLNFSKNN